MTSVRELMDGIEPGPSLILTLLWAAGLIAVFGSLTMWRYRDAR